MCRADKPLRHPPHEACLQERALCNRWNKPAQESIVNRIVKLTLCLSTQTHLPHLELLGSIFSISCEDTPILAASAGIPSAKKKWPSWSRCKYSDAPVILFPIPSLLPEGEGKIEKVPEKFTF